MYVPRVVNDNSCLAPYHKLFVSIHLHIDAQNFVDHMLRALIVITTIIYKLLVTGVSNNNNITIINKY